MSGITKAQAALFDSSTDETVHEALHAADRHTDVRRIVQGDTWAARLTDGKTVIRVPLNLSIRQVTALSALDDDADIDAIAHAMQSVLQHDDYEALLDAPMSDAVAVLRLYMQDLADYNGARDTTLGE